MRGLLAFVVLAACGHPSAPPIEVRPSGMPRLLPSTPIDPQARGAAYLTAFAVQLQPGWGQFLDDCRLRLPATHPLNQLALETHAALVIDRLGKVTDVQIAGSGNPDFDRAVREAIADAMPFAAPPPELLSDDDQLHLRWLFARDRRQAGPATAEIVAFTMPLAGVVDRWLATGQLARAARRIASAPQDPDRPAATQHVMIASLREALGSTETAVRRAAVEAIGRARVVELATEVRGVITVTSDTELRIAAMAASAALGDHEAGLTIVHQLQSDLPEHPRLALAETSALVQLGRTSDATAAIHALLDADQPHVIALQALALAPIPELGTKLATWFDHGDVRTRAGVCAALAGFAPHAAWPLIERGLRDRDATVRATCTQVVPAAGAVIPRLRELTSDRDQAVRAHAIAALVKRDPVHFVHAVDDPAAEVRAAYAAALVAVEPVRSSADLKLLIDDRDPDVRAAAWAAYAGSDHAELAARAARDSAPQVRRAAVFAIDDDELLGKLASADDSPDVRTAALVQLAGRRGRVAIADHLLEILGAAPIGSAERVRAALAWLLAR